MRLPAQRHGSLINGKVNARFCDRPETPALKPALVSNNPCQESVSAWLLVRMFFDTQRSASLTALR
jgi:hypothetical protein